MKNVSTVAFALSEKLTSNNRIEYSPFIMLYLGYIGTDCVISELCYKGTILQSNDRKITISWSFFYDSFENSMVKKIWSYNMTLLYTNLCYNDVCFKGTALYLKFS